MGSAAIYGIPIPAVIYVTMEAEWETVKEKIKAEVKGDSENLTTSAVINICQFK